MDKNKLKCFDAEESPSIMNSPLYHPTRQCEPRYIRQPWLIKSDPFDFIEEKVEVVAVSKTPHIPHKLTTKQKAVWWLFLAFLVIGIPTLIWTFCHYVGTGIYGWPADTGAHWILNYFGIWLVLFFFSMIAGLAELNS